MTLLTLLAYALMALLWFAIGVIVGAVSGFKTGRTVEKLERRMNSGD